MSRSTNPKRGLAPRKADVVGVEVSVTTPQETVDEVILAAIERRHLAVTALAVHGLVTAATDDDFRAIVGEIDIVAPDGQPVRWALNVLHDARLSQRVYGPDLMRSLCSEAAQRGIPIFLYGSTRETCRKLAGALPRQYPGLQIADCQPDRFREATPDEDAEDRRRIRASGAGIVFVGRGCPRQERFIAKHRDHVAAPLVAVGAAFDYLAGNLRRPPPWVQRAGLEWAWRLSLEPRRLWKRYVVTNSTFVTLLAGQVLRKWARRSAHDGKPAENDETSHSGLAQLMATTFRTPLNAQNRQTTDVASRGSVDHG